MAETNTVMTFGKHKGIAYDALPASYVTWIVEKMDHKYLTESLRTWLTENGHTLKKIELKPIPGVKPDSRIVDFGKFKNTRYDSIPTDYLKYLLKSADAAKNGGEKAYTCENTEILEYARSRV